MQTALKLGRISAPIIFAVQQDQRLRELLTTRLTKPEERSIGMDVAEFLARFGLDTTSFE